MNRCRAPRVCGCVEKVRAGTAKGQRGSGRPEHQWRQENGVAEPLTGGEVVGEIRRVRGRDQEGLAWGKL